VTPELELAPPSADPSPGQANAPEPTGRADEVMLDSPLPELQRVALETPSNEQVEAAAAVPVDVAGK
jgi:hypothetical protein